MNKQPGCNGFQIEMVLTMVGSSNGVDKVVKLCTWPAGGARLPPPARLGPALAPAVVGVARLLAAGKTVTSLVITVISAISAYQARFKACLKYKTNYLN